MTSCILFANKFIDLILGLKVIKCLKIIPFYNNNKFLNILIQKHLLVILIVFQDKQKKNDDFKINSHLSPMLKNIQRAFYFAMRRFIMQRTFGRENKRTFKATMRSFNMRCTFTWQQSTNQMSIMLKRVRYKFVLICSK